MEVESPTRLVETFRIAVPSSAHAGGDCAAAGTVPTATMAETIDRRRFVMGEYYRPTR